LKKKEGHLVPARERTTKRRTRKRQKIQSRGIITGGGRGQVEKKEKDNVKAGVDKNNQKTWKWGGKCWSARNTSHHNAWGPDRGGKKEVQEMRLHQGAGRGKARGGPKTGGKKD